MSSTIGGQTSNIPIQASAGNQSPRATPIPTTPAAPGSANTTPVGLPNGTQPTSVNSSTTPAVQQATVAASGASSVQQAQPRKGKQDLSLLPDGSPCPFGVRCHHPKCRFSHPAGGSGGNQTHLKKADKNGGSQPHPTKSGGQGKPDSSRLRADKNVSVSKERRRKLRESRSSDDDDFKVPKRAPKASSYDSDEYYSGLDSSSDEDQEVRVEFEVVDVTNGSQVKQVKSMTKKQYRKEVKRTVSRANKTATILSDKVKDLDAERAGLADAKREFDKQREELIDEEGKKSQVEDLGGKIIDEFGSKLTKMVGLLHDFKRAIRSSFRHIDGVEFVVPAWDPALEEHLTWWNRVKLTLLKHLGTHDMSVEAVEHLEKIPILPGDLLSYSFVLRGNALLFEPDTFGTAMLDKFTIEVNDLLAAFTLAGDFSKTALAGLKVKLNLVMVSELETVEKLVDLRSDNKRSAAILHADLRADVIVKVKRPLLPKKLSLWSALTSRIKCRLPFAPKKLSGDWQFLTSFECSAESLMQVVQTVVIPAWDGISDLKPVVDRLKQTVELRVKGTYTVNVDRSRVLENSCVTEAVVAIVMSGMFGDKTGFHKGGHLRGRCASGKEAV